MLMSRRTIFGNGCRRYELLGKLGGGHWSGGARTVANAHEDVLRMRESVWRGDEQSGLPGVLGATRQFASAE